MDSNNLAKNLLVVMSLQKTYMLIWFASLRLPAPSGIKPPPSTEPSSQDEPAPAPMESTRPQVVAGPFKLDSSKYVLPHKHAQKLWYFRF